MGNSIKINRSEILLFLHKELSKKKLMFSFDESHEDSETEYLTIFIGSINAHLFMEFEEDILVSCSYYAKDSSEDNHDITLHETMENKFDSTGEILDSVIEIIDIARDLNKIYGKINNHLSMAFSVADENDIDEDQVTNLFNNIINSRE